MNIKSLFIITAATAISATGCYAEVGDPTEDSEIALAGENASDADEMATDEELALTDAVSDENTGESEEALATWGRRGWGRGGWGRGGWGRGGWGGGFVGGFGAGCFDPCFDPCLVDPCLVDPCLGGIGGIGGFW